MTGAGSRNFNRIADRYESNRGGQARGARIAPDLAVLLDQACVIELGVGSGVVAKPLQELRFRVVGVDIAWRMLTQARDRLGGNVVCGDAMHLPFSTQSVPQIVCAWVLHTVGDVGAVMSEVRRVLKPGGRCLVVETKPSTDDDLGAQVLRDLQTELGVAARDRDVRNYARSARQVELDVHGVVVSGPHPYETSLADVVRDIETRFSSWMWEIPEDDWTNATSAVLERLRAQPDFERRFTRDGYQEILVLGSGSDSP